MSILSGRGTAWRSARTLKVENQRGLREMGEAGLVERRKGAAGRLQILGRRRAGTKRSVQPSIFVARRSAGIGHGAWNARQCDRMPPSVTRAGLVQLWLVSPGLAGRRQMPCRHGGERAGAWRGVAMPMTFDRQLPATAMRAVSRHVYCHRPGSCGDRGLALHYPSSSLSRFLAYLLSTGCLKLSRMPVEPQLRRDRRAELAGIVDGIHCA